ncbi:MAG TPA: oxidoreductase [Myxococcaceae bacterium]|jgi:ferredoxin-NADP reductase
MHSSVVALREAPAPRRKVQELEAMVADVVVETHDTVTLVLFTGRERPEYRAGQFCTIDPHQFGELDRWVDYLEAQKGKKEPPRAYSLTSAPHERHVAITIKEEPFIRGTTKYPPLLSPLLVRQLPRGAPMRIVGFTGPYTLPDDVESKTDHLVHLVAGSGAVPNFAILKDCLHRGLQMRHTFVCSNKTWEDIPFRAPLERLLRQYPDKLRVVHALTREDGTAHLGPDVRKGRINLELLRELIPDPSGCLVYACGPAIGPHERARAKELGQEPAPRFLESALGYLKELGVPDARVKRESYG